MLLVVKQESNHIDVSVMIVFPDSSKVSDLNLNTPMTALPTMSCKDAVQLMHVSLTRNHDSYLKANSEIIQDHGFDQLPVVNSDNEVVGMITEGNLISLLRGCRISGNAAISEVLCT